jgi:hypothetical protein
MLRCTPLLFTITFERSEHTPSPVMSNRKSQLITFDETRRLKDQELCTIRSPNAPDIKWLDHSSRRRATSRLGQTETPSTIALPA